jgi:hypothetical protein
MLEFKAAPYGKHQIVKLLLTVQFKKGHFSFCEKIYSMREGLPCVAGGKDNLWLQLHTLYSQFGLLCQVRYRYLSSFPVPLSLK